MIILNAITNRQMQHEHQQVRVPIDPIGLASNEGNTEEALDQKLHRLQMLTK